MARPTSRLPNAMPVGLAGFKRLLELDRHWIWPVRLTRNFREAAVNVELMPKLGGDDRDQAQLDRKSVV